MKSEFLSWSKINFLFILIFFMFSKTLIAYSDWDGSYDANFNFKMSPSTVCKKPLPIKIKIIINSGEVKGKISNDGGDNPHPFCKFYHNGNINGTIDENGEVSFKIRQKESHSLQYSSNKIIGNIDGRLKLISRKSQYHPIHIFQFIKQEISESELKALKLEEEKAGLMVENFMANQAEGIDLTAIPDEDKGMITEFSMNQKQIYADAAQAAGSMKAGSPEKLEQIAIMKQANQRLQNVEKQYNAWGGMREDYIQDFQSKNN